MNGFLTLAEAAEFTLIKGLFWSCCCEPKNGFTVAFYSGLASWLFGCSFEKGFEKRLSLGCSF
jgi:hypothetical protein